MATEKEQNIYVHRTNPPRICMFDSAYNLSYHHDLINQNHALNAWFARPFKGLLPAASQDAPNEASNRTPFAGCLDVF